MPLPIREPGLAFVCCMCLHMAEAYDKGLKDCGKSACGGPLLGKTFPLYKGPMEGNLILYCYRCGRRADMIMEIESPEKTCPLGFCKLCMEEMPKKELDFDNTDR